MVSTAELMLGCHVDDHVPTLASVLPAGLLGSAPFAVVGTWCECHMAGSSCHRELQATNSMADLGDGLCGLCLFWI